MPAIFFTEFPSPLGTLTLAGTELGLAGLWLEGQRYFGSALLVNAQTDSSLACFQAAGKWLTEYFSGCVPEAQEVPLDLRGTAFQIAVWRLLLKIPYGKTVTYGEIAAQLTVGTGRPASARAVGSAVGRNPVSIIIPCHRVLGANGQLTGYAGGLERKRWLLEHEKL